MRRKKILVFTGAGVSAESGVKTFRDSGNGLWDNYRVEEVADINGWMKDPSKSIEFYNIRRREMNTVVHNDAHTIISELQSDFDVCLVTQNVDDLHEKAGSKNVIHLHGELSLLRSEFNCETKKLFEEDLKLGDLCPEGGQWRPDVVWFGEELDTDKLELVRLKAEEADVCVIVGTSMVVSPANMIPWMTKDTCIIYYVDPSDIEFTIPKQRRPFFYHIQKKATEGMIDIKKELEDMFI